jgi:hypothetical protein
MGDFPYINRPVEGALALAPVDAFAVPLCLPTALDLFRVHQIGVQGVESPIGSLQPYDVPVLLMGEEEGQFFELVVAEPLELERVSRVG